MTLIRKRRRLPLAASGIAAGVAIALLASPMVAANAASTALSGSVGYSMTAPYVDSVRGTAISVTLSGSAFREDDSVYFGVIAKPGAAVSLVKQMDPTDDVSAGFHATASVSYATWKLIGNVGWRVWIDANDNGKYDAAERTLASTDETAFKFAGPPTSIDLTSDFDMASSGVPGDDSFTAGTVFVAEGTCRVFTARVTDENGTGVKGQQLVLSFQSGVPGSRPVACSAAQLAGLTAGAATTQDGGNVVTGISNNDGEVDFALQGVKGQARYRGAISFDLKVASPKSVSATPATIQTKTGFNKGVASLSATDVDPLPYKKSKSSFTITATSADGLPLQGVVLSAAAMSVDKFGDSDTPGATDTIVTLGGTNASGQTTYTVDTSKSSVQRIYIWSDLGTKGLGGTEIFTTVDLTVQPQAISRVNSEFTNAAEMVPTDKATNTLTLTLKDFSDTAVKDVDVTFSQLKESALDSTVSISPLAATTDAFGQIAVTVTRSAADKSDQLVCVVATITASLTSDSFTTCYTIEFRRATALSLVTPSRFTAVNGSTTTIRAKLTDQFGDGFAGDVLFTSVGGRNMDTVVKTTSSASGLASIGWQDKAGAGDATDSITISHKRAGDSEMLYAPSVQFDYVTAEQAVANNIALNVDSRTYLTYDDTTQPNNGVHGQLRNSAGNYLYGRDLTVTASGPVELLSWNGSSWVVVSRLDAISNGEDGGFDINYRATGLADNATFTVSDGTASRTFTTLVTASGYGARNLRASASSGAISSGHVIRTTVTVTDVYGNPVSPNAAICARAVGIGRFTTGRLRETLTGDDFQQGVAYIDAITNSAEAGAMTLSLMVCDTEMDHFWASAGYPFSGAGAAKASDSVIVAVSSDGAIADVSAKLDALLKNTADSSKQSADAIAGVLAAVTSGNAAAGAAAKQSADAIATVLAAVNSGNTALVTKIEALSKSVGDSAAAVKQATDLLNQVNGQLVAVNTILSGVSNQVTALATASSKYSSLNKELKKQIDRFIKAYPVRR